MKYVPYKEPTYTIATTNGKALKAYERACVENEWPIIFYHIMTRYACVEMDLILIPHHTDITHSETWEQAVIALFHSIGMEKREQFTVRTWIHTRKCPIEQAENLARGLLELYKQFFIEVNSPLQGK